MNTEICIDAKTFFLSQLEDCEQIEYPGYPNSIFYVKNGEVLFEKKEKIKYFWIKFIGVWSYMENNFNMTNKEIQALTKKTIEEEFGMFGFSTDIRTFEEFQIQR